MTSGWGVRSMAVLAALAGTLGASQAAWAGDDDCRGPRRHSGVSISFGSGWSSWGHGSHRDSRWGSHGGSRWGDHARYGTSWHRRWKDDCDDGWGHKRVGWGSSWKHRRDDDCDDWKRPVVVRPICPPPVVVKPVCPTPVVVRPRPCPPVVRYRPVVVERPVYVERPVVIEQPVYVEQPVVVHASLPPAARPEDLRSTSDRELGDTYLRLGDASNALRVYQQHLERIPGDAAAQRGIGLAALMLGDPESAFRAFERAYRVDPGLASRPVSVAAFPSPFEFRRVLDDATRAADQLDTGGGWLTVAVLLQTDGRAEQSRAALGRAKAAGLEPVIFTAMNGAIPQ